MVRTLANDFAIVEHDDAVGVHNGADALRNDEFRGILRFLFERVTYGTVGFEVERGEGIVEDQDFRMTVDGACDRQTLLLPARNVGTALRNAGIVLLLLFVDEFRRLRDVACAAHGVVVAVRISVRDVAGDRSLEQERLLRHVADLVAQGLQVVVAHVHAAKRQLAAGHVVQTRDELHE